MRHLRYVWPWLAGLLLWELGGRLGWISHFVFPWPSLILKAAFEESGLIADAGMSLVRVGFGFLLAVFLGTALGFALGLNRSFGHYVEPALNFLRPIPPVAWIPLAILWFGLGNAPAFFLTFIASFFPITLSAAAGVRAIAREHFQVAACLGASRQLVFRRVVWPGALPHVLAGYRIGFGVAWMAVVAAEMIAARSGLGHLIHVGQDVLRTDLVMAGMMAIGAIGLLGDGLIGLIARRWAPWANA